MEDWDSMSCLDVQDPTGQEPETYFLTVINEDDGDETPLIRGHQPILPIR